MTEEQFKTLKSDAEATISSDFFDNDTEFGLYVLGITDLLQALGATSIDVLGVETSLNHLWNFRDYWDKDYEGYRFKDK